MTTEELIALAQAGNLKKSFYTQLYILLHQNKYHELESILQHCSEASRQTDWYRLNAKCLLNQNHFAQALSCLQWVPTENKAIILGDLLLCYEKLSLIDEGIALIDERLAHEFQISLLLKKIYFLNIAKRHEEILSLLNDILPKFPHNQDLKVAHAQCLSVLDKSNFGSIIRQYNQAHPENVQLWMIQFWHLFHSPNAQLAHHLIMEILYKFPMCIEAQLGLIKAHLLRGNHIDASLSLLFFQYTFKTQERALSLMQDLLQAHPELGCIERPASIKVDLPSVILEIFASINVPGVNVSYVVGSANHQMIKKGSLVEIDDIDFVSNGHPLEASAFSPSPYIPNLYSKQMLHEGFLYKCEYFVNPIAQAKMIEIDVLKRDFTVNSIYCDQEGNIIDPTGLGLLDLQHLIIRTIVSSRESINEDPIRILRAIKLMLKGLRPTPELEYAISQWQPHATLNQGHINAVCKKLFSSFKFSDIVQHFSRYRLFEKMFQFNIEGLNEQEIYQNLSFVMHSSSRQKRFV